MNILDLKRKLLPMSGFMGGGGSSGSTSGTSTTGLPDWAKGYAQETLAKQAALSDRPYEAYGGDRIAGFDPMQTQAQQQAAGMQTSPELGRAAGIAGDIASRAQGAYYAPGQFSAQQVGTQSFTQPGAADQYMSPYMQNVVDIQKREAGRQSAIQGTQQQAQAAQAGAFGGSRDAIMRAERERNLGQQMGDIQATGSQAAFQQAQQQFNAEQQARMQAQMANQQAGMTAQQAAEQSRQYGAGYGLQGLQAGLSAAGQLGALGGQQFQQGMDINRLQAAYGAQKQAMNQQGLSQAYQDFLAQKEYPQQQLGNMANMIRGLPIGSTTSYTGTVNPATPSFGQQLGSLGSAAWGLKQFFAEGGSVDSQQNIESIVSKLLDPALDQAEEAAKARGDQVQLEAIQTEKAARASMRRGLASLPVNMDNMLPTEQSMARGGIVAFAYGGKSGDPERDVGPSYDEDDEVTDAPAQGPGSQAIYEDALRQQLGYNKQLAGLQPSSYTPEQRQADFRRIRAELQEGAGPSPYEEERANIKRMQGESAQNLKYGRGLAALQASAAMLQGQNFVGGLAAGAGAFGSAYGDAIKADQAQKLALQNRQFNLLDAERKEKMGLNREAREAVNAAQKNQQDADKFKIEKLKALGVMAGKTAVSARPGAAAKPPAPPKWQEQLAEVEIALAKDPKNPELQAKARALRSTAQQLAVKTVSSTTDIGSTSAALKGESQDITKQTAASNAWDKVSSKLQMSPEYRNAKDADRARILDDAKVEVYSRFSLAPPKAATAPAPKAVPASQIPAGTTFGKAVPGKGTEVLKDGKVIGYAN